MKTLLILVSLLFLSVSNLMHEDTLLEIDKDGNIIGLPEKYNPAIFDLDKKYLRINDKEIVFPDCLNYYFNVLEKSELNLSASWYHEKENIPYYLNFNISQKDLNYGYNILVDLESLDLIYLRKWIKEGNRYHSPKIELEEKCREEYKIGIKIKE